MKKIYYMLLAILAMSFTFTACSDEDPFSTATADDEPRILDPIFPDGKDGNLPLIAEINRDENLTMKLRVTPADHTSVSWLIDGHEVETGTALDISLKAGTYRFKVIISTEAGKSTYREGNVLVKPLSDDPWATEKDVERIIVPGAKARLYGDNLKKVKSIVIEGKTITDIVYVEDGKYIEYAVPTELTDGDHRVILVDGGSNEYGANIVKVTRDAVITAGASRTNANIEWVMTGVNLDKVVSLTFNGQIFNEFIRQSDTEIVITSPDLEDGEYKLTGKTNGGEDLQFYSNKDIVTELEVVVSSEIVLWQGHHYVSWDLPDGNPNKTFNLIGKDVFANIKAGATLSIHYSIASGDEYHKMQTTSGWWGDLPGTSEMEFTEDGVKEVILTQEALDKIQAEDGFLCVGHGYYVDMVTVL